MKKFLLFVFASLLALAAGAAQPQDSLRVLSLNNSLIDYNDQYLMFNRIAESQAVPAAWTKHTRLGKPLSYHFAEGTWLAPDGLPSAKMLVRAEPWTHIILQEQSSTPRTDYPLFRDNVKAWVDYIRANCPNPNAQILLPVNWAYSGDWDRYTADNLLLLDNYFRVADEFGLTVVPVAAAYQAIYEAEGPQGTLTWYTDNRHPSPKASYLAALMEYATVTGTPPMSVTWHPGELSEQDAISARAYANTALTTFARRVQTAAAKAPAQQPVKPRPDWSGLDLEALSAAERPTADYKYHIYIEDLTGYPAVGAYLHGKRSPSDTRETEVWGEWPGQAPLGTEVIDGVTYKVFGHNEPTGTFQLIFNNWNNRLQLPDFPIPAGRDLYLRATPDALTEVHPDR